jgi:hypothetical protein
MIMRPSRSDGRPWTSPIFAFASRIVCVATLPSGTIRLGLTSSTCSWSQGLQALISLAWGRRFFRVPFAFLVGLCFTTFVK